MILKPMNGVMPVQCPQMDYDNLFATGDGNVLLLSVLLIIMIGLFPQMPGGIYLILTM